MKRALVLFAPMLLGLALASGCFENSEAEPKAAPTPVATPAPPPLGNIKGQVTLEGESDHSGTLVFLGGTGLSAYTDREGYFTIADVPSGVYTVTAMRPDFKLRHLDDVRIDVDKPGTREIELIARRLERDDSRRRAAPREYGEIVGVARYADREEHAGINIHVEYTSYNALTDDTGAYRIRKIEPGTYTLRFFAKGYRERRIQVDVRADLTTTPQGEGESDVIALEPVARGEGLRTVQGVVEMFNAQGQRVNRFGETWVALEGTSYVAVPDGEGRFVMDDIKPGVYTVVPQAPGFQPPPERVQVDLRDRMSAVVQLRLYEIPEQRAAIGAVAGVVRLADEAMPDGVQVGLAGTELVALTDGSGQFVLNGAPVGVHSLVVSNAGYHKTVVEGVVVTQDRETNVGTIVLEPVVEPPVVLSTSPSNGESDVAIRWTVPVYVQFSHRMDIGSVLSALSVSPAVRYKAYMGRQHPESDDETLFVEFEGFGEGAMKFGQRYTVRIAKSARDLKGVNLEESYAFSFRTGEAMVIATEPAEGQTAVLRNVISDAVVVYFNAPIDYDTLNENSITIRPGEGETPTVRCDNDPETGWTVAFIRRNWTPSTKYTITIGSRVRLIDGWTRVSNTPYRFSFRTAKPEDIGDILGPDSAERTRRR